ncbi:MAG: beta-propeller domain-containing protein, partial [Clostridiales Family XIII bacterium]|nr:beta-propeller domain-containing protein [Clostridiales Family XIII bacterium]
MKDNTDKNKNADNVERLGEEAEFSENHTSAPDEEAGFDAQHTSAPDEEAGFDEQHTSALGGKITSALGELTEANPPKLDFYKDFDQAVPSANEMFESIGKRAGRAIKEEERTRKRRVKKYAWATSGAFAAAVAIIVLVTTVYTPGAFTDWYSSDSISASEEAFDETGIDSALVAGDSGTIVDVNPAELPAPQSDYEDIYDALDASTGIDLRSSIAQAKKYADGGTSYGEGVVPEAEIGMAIPDTSNDVPPPTAASGSARSAEPAPPSAPSDAPEASGPEISPPPTAMAPDDSVTADASPPLSVEDAAPAEATAPAEDAASVEDAAPTEAAAPSENPVQAKNPVQENGSTTADSADAGADTAYSDTNVQTEGVQEADVVKTDGNYIYTANSESICITAANNGHPDVLSEIDQVTDDGQVYFEMYISGDTLTLIRNGYNNLKGKDGKVKNPTKNGDIDYPGNQGMVDTSVDIYDVSDRENPHKVRSLSQSGRYTDSRMIGDKLYLISTYDDFDYASIDRKIPRTYVPLYFDGDRQVTSKPEDIAIPSQIESMSYMVISGIDTKGAKFVSHESLLGESYTTYASQGNLYLTASKSANQREDIGRYHVEYDSDCTRITRLSLKAGVVQVESSADVPGTVNDQFSLDEYDGFLRVVTTMDEYAYVYYGENNEDEEYTEEYYDEENEDGEALSRSERDAKSIAQIEKKYGQFDWYGDAIRSSRSTGLYILGMDLKTVGEVNNLAPGEDVYSCRFMGDVAYFVTFRNTDPLFSVDLSYPKQPRVLGKLKIPGFSEYLHPYADGLLFGLGSDADEDTGEVKSLKVSMFDNSQPFNVKEKDKLI